MYDAAELLAMLSEAHGPSGYEDEVRSLVWAEATKHTRNLELDQLGNVFAGIKGRSDRPRIMISAHMDEVGFIITYIEGSGFLRFRTLGVVDPRILLGQRVVLKADKRHVGVIGSKPPHALTSEEMRKPIELGDLYIDIGASSREEVKHLGVDIGSAATFDIHFSRMSTGSLVVGKAFDNRAGCAASLMLMEMLAHSPPLSTTIFAFTVQEEVGMRGAKIAADHVAPDAALVFETTPALDCPDVEPKGRILSLGCGPALRVMDGSMIAQRIMLDYMKGVAQAKGIPYQLHINLGAQNEAGPIHLSREGVPTGVLSTPCRYLHGPALILSLEDLNYLPKFAEAVVRGVERSDQFIYKVTDWKPNQPSSIMSKHR